MMLQKRKFLLVSTIVLMSANYLAYAGSVVNPHQDNASQLSVSKKTFASARMPQYQYTFHIPEGVAEGDIIFRFYQEWGDGTASGWQQPAAMPHVTIDDKPVAVWNMWSYEYNYEIGSFGLGYDQFAQYAGVGLLKGGSKIKITGTYDQVAYFSAVLSYYISRGKPDGRIEVVDADVTPLLIDNPYIVDNPSVFSYPPSHSSTASKDHSLHNVNALRKRNIPLPQFVNKNTGKIEFYRLDKQNSNDPGFVVDDIAPDGCSRAYLFARKDDKQAFAIIRVKVPTTFIESDRPDHLFSHYQARYFSIGAHTQDAWSNLGYWTVNARMLKKYADKDGYAYVFFTPDAYSKQLATAQQTPATEPPVMTWGRYTGYVLGDPSYAVILRYRIPDWDWQGSPEHAECYATLQENEPVTFQALGDYTPALYGDTQADFEHGHIGDVDKNQPWPDQH